MDRIKTETVGSLSPNYLSEGRARVSVCGVQSVPKVLSVSFQDTNKNIQKLKRGLQLSTIVCFPSFFALIYERTARVFLYAPQVYVRHSGSRVGGA